MGVAYVFSKIQPKATIIATITLICRFSFISSAWFGTNICIICNHTRYRFYGNKSIQSFGVSALITVIITTVLGNTFVLSAIILVLIASLIIGQLLKERTSKDVIRNNSSDELNFINRFYVTTNIRKDSTISEHIKPFKQTLHEAITMSGADANMTQILEEGFRQATVQLPGFIIIITFLIVLINLIVTFPVLRKFKIATPVFKPLFAWQ